MNIVYAALVFTTVFMFALIAICFLVLRENSKIEKENLDLKEKLAAYEQERRAFGH